MARLNQALKVEVSALTASFRYPRVQVGRLPTFDMPPPATIYGQLAAVIGDWFDPAALEFSYVFTHQGKADDLETVYPISKGPGKPTLAKRGWPHNVNVTCSTNIQRRQFLLHPHMTLYLMTPDESMLEAFRAAFLSPYFALLLGRSQDLATCHSARIVPLDRSADAYFENTLLPFDWRPWVSPGLTVLLPESIDYRRQRLAVQGRYLQIEKPGIRISSPDDVFARDRLPGDFTIDPETTRHVNGLPVSRGLHFWPLRASVDAA